MKKKLLPSALLAFAIAAGGLTTSMPATASDPKPVESPEATKIIEQADVKGEHFDLHHHEEEEAHHHEEETVSPLAAGVPELGNGHVVPGPNVPLVKSPDGSINPLLPEHDHEASAPATGATGVSAQNLLTPSNLQTRVGNIKVTIVTARLADRTSAQTRAMDMAAIDRSVSQSSAYWKSMSNNRLSMSTVQKLIDVPTVARSTWSYPDIMAQVRRDVQWTDGPYEALMVFIPADSLSYGGYTGYLGAGWSNAGVGGSILMPNPKSAYTNPVVAHEYGHVLGILHANSLQCTNGRADVAISSGRWADSSCTSREYGDTLDLMGTSQYVMPVINSLFWDAGGFGRGDEVRNVGVATGSKTYNLPAWSGTGANRAVKFTDPVSKEVYYLEMRAPVGYDAGNAYNLNHGVKVIKRDRANMWALNSVVIPPSTRPFAGYYNTNHAWQTGQTFTTYAGTKVKINHLGETTASVTITAPSVATSGGASIANQSNVVAVDSAGVLWNYGNVNSPRVRIGAGWHVFQEIHVTDWNSDGIADILGQHKDGSLYLYKGYSAGGFEKTKIGNGWGNYETVVGKWKTTDKHPSLIARHKTTGELFNYPNPSGAAFGSRAKIGSGWHIFNDLTMVDWDKDGKEDILARSSNGEMKLYRANGAGGFVSESRKVIGRGWNVMTTATGVDNFRGSGNKGVIAKDTSGRLFYYGTGNGTWHSRIQIGNGWTPYNVASH